VPTFGGFDAWAGLLGSVLGFAGIKGFLGNFDALLDEVDEEGAAWEDFFRLWHRIYGDRALRVADLVAALTDHSFSTVVGEDGRPLTGNALRPPSASGEGQMRLADVLPSELNGARENRGRLAQLLGFALRKRMEQVFGCDGIMLRLVREQDRSHVARWRLVVVGASANPPEAAQTASAG
jgi:hypothetical protein